MFFFGVDELFTPTVFEEVEDFPHRAFTRFCAFGIVLVLIAISSTAASSLPLFIHDNFEPMMRY